MAGVDDSESCFRVRVQRVKSAVVVAVSGPVDMETAPAVTHEIDSALAGRPAVLIIDLRCVEFLASAGLQCLAHAHATSQGRTSVAVVTERSAVSREITLAGLDKLVALYRTLDEAIDAC